MRKPSAAPTPIPAFAPVERPLPLLDGSGERVAFAFEGDVGMADVGEDVSRMLEELESGDAVLGS